MCCCEEEIRVGFVLKLSGGSSLVFKCQLKRRGWPTMEGHVDQLGSEN